MEEKPSAPKRRLEKRSGRTIFLAFAVLAALLVAAIFFLYPRDKSSEQLSPGSSSPLSTETSTEDKLSSQNDITNPSQTSQDDSEPHRKGVEADQTDTSKEDLYTIQNGADTDTQQAAPETSADTGDKAAEGGSQISTVDIKDVCSPYLDNVEDFFATLDSRAYIHDFQLDESSSLYFPALIQKLADNPPVVTGETNDLYTVLKNTAHFFRIIGKKNILVLKGILDREKETFEQTLADFYNLTNNPQCLKERFNLDLNEEALYLYSGFFLNTMGGRLYLFRRDSKSRMVVNFYAILIIDQENRRGKNKYGIPLTEAIDKLIEEIESTRIELKLRDYYLDTLYDMKEKYQ